MTEEEFGQATGKLLPRLGGIQSGQKQSWLLEAFAKVRIDVYSQESEERKELSTPLFATNNFTFSSHTCSPKKPCSFLLNVSHRGQLHGPYVAGLSHHLCIAPSLPSACWPRRSDLRSGFTEQLPLCGRI